MVLPDPGPWTCTVGELDGTSHGALNAAPVQLDWELNSLGSNQAYMAATDATAALLFPSGGGVVDSTRLVRCFCDGNFVKSIVPNPRQSSGPPNVLTLDGPGFAYHLKRRFIGRLNSQPNLVTINPNFPTDLAGWAAFGGASVAWSSTAGPDGDPGTASVGVSGISTNPTGLQNVTLIDVGGYPFDTFLWVTTWINVNTSVADYMVPPDGFALAIRLEDSLANLLWEQGETIDWRIKGSWQRVRMKVYVPGGLGVVKLRVQLRAPESGALFDDVVVRQEERLYANGDPGTVITLLVAHAQDTGIGKTDLFIGTNVVDGGSTSIIRAYKYSGRANIMASIAEMETLDGGVDWLPEEPALNTWEISVYNQLGYEPPGGRLSFTLGVDIASYEWAWPIDQRADRVGVMGRGDGFEVDEGLWVDQLSPDLGWETFVAARVEGFTDTEQQAIGLGRQMRKVPVLRITVHRTDTFDPVDFVQGDGALLPARLCDVDVQDGQVDLNEGMKIIKTSLNCATHTATVDLVPVTELDAS